MAGRRQLIEAKEVTVLESKSLQVEIGMFTHMPKQYREHPDNSPLCLAWLDAVDASRLLHVAMQKLGDKLRRKANIAEPGPSDQLITAKGEPCEAAPEGWNLASACVELVRRRARVDIDPDGRTGATVEPQGMGRHSPCGAS